MGAMVSDFPALPQDEDEDRATGFGAVYAQFKARNVPLPQEDPTKVKRATVLGLLQTVGGALIKAELAADPARPEDKRLYEGKNDEQVAEAMNQLRIGRIFVGLPFAPNAVTAEDIAAAKV